MHQNFYVVSQILRGYWLIDPAFAQAHLPMVKSLLEGNGLAWDHKAREQNPSNSSKELKSHGLGYVDCFAVAYGGRDRQYFASFDEAPQGSIAVVKLAGPLMKNDGFCSTGTATLRAYLQQAEQHPNIAGAIQWIDSPGGTVDGTQDFANTARNFQKPLITYVDGLAASAGYWIGSAGREIIVNNDTAMLGSIGTMITLTDYSQMYEQYGLKEYHIFADKSKDKNRAYLEALKGNDKIIKAETLNPLNEVFLQAVQNHRPELKKETLTGKTYLGSQAIALGLADYMGDFAFALDRLEQMIAQEANLSVKKSNSTSNHNYKTMSLKSWLKGEKPAEGATSDAKMEVEQSELEQLRADMETTQSELENLQTQNQALTQSNEELQGQNQTLATQLSEVQAELATMTAERDQFQRQAAEYGQQPGAMHSEPQKPGGDQLEEDPNEQIIANLPSSKELDENEYFN